MTTLTQSLPVSLGGSVQQITSGFAAFFERAKVRRERKCLIRSSIAELEACSDRVLADLGIYRCDIPRLVRESLSDA